MRNIITILSIILTTITFGQATDKNNIGSILDTDWSKSWAEYNPNKRSYNSHELKIDKNISSNITLKNTHTYLLEGHISVINNATLTIEEGTVMFAWRL